MRAGERACGTVASDLSALLDGELGDAQARALDDHVDHCESCAAELQRLGTMRRALRAGLADDVPDLVAPIMARVGEEASKKGVRREWNLRFRIAATAAATAIAVLIGASLPGGDDPPNVAAASVIAREVRAEARTLRTYRATFSITEEGWDQRVGTRRFSAEVFFKEPGSFSLKIEDGTAYPPGLWPANDVELVANPSAWWIKEPSSCPPSALPGCEPPTSVGIDERALVSRQPFDGTIGLPTDIILPLQTLSDSPTFSVGGTIELLGRRARHLSLAYRQAAPLIGSLQGGGLWRDFYPSDRVQLWIDEATGFPLKFEVTAAAPEERLIWARGLGYQDKAGQTLLTVRATNFSEPQSFPPGTFRAPQQGTVASGAFTAVSFDGASEGLAPEFVAGLDPFVAGTTDTGQRVLSYAQGMEWLRVLGDDRPEAGAAELRSEELRLADGSWAYYEPASANHGRRLEMFGSAGHILVETNLPRATLLKIAASIDFSAERLSRDEVARGSFFLQRIDVEGLDEIGFVRVPEYLPAGYTARAASTSSTPTGNKTATAYYRGPESEYDGLGIRITQSKGVDLLPPSAEHAVHIMNGQTPIRWFPERGEIDWIDHGVYTSISAPSFPRSTALAIAEGLR